MRFIIFAVTIICTAVTALAQDDFSKETIRSTKLTSTLYMLEGAGGNMTASIGSDGTLLVDCDFAEMSEKLLAKLKEIGGASPRTIVNTHFHYDHTGGNQVFGPTAVVIAATQVRDRLKSEQILWKKPHPAFPESALPILTFDTSLTLHANEDDIEVVHYKAGHTDGDSVVFFKNAKVASLGDLYFSGMYPIFHPEHGGGIEGYLRALDLILQKLPPDAQIVPGHGPLAHTVDLKLYRQMIAASIETVRRGIKRKMTLKQIQVQGLANTWEPYSHGYRSTDQWLESVYNDLRR